MLDGVVVFVLSTSTPKGADDYLWGEAGPLGGTHAGGRWGPMARRRRRFVRHFFFFCAIFHLFSWEHLEWEFGVLGTCGHAITPCDSLSALLTVP